MSPDGRADTHPTMAGTSPNPYLKTQVMTARPEQLRLMLLDGAVRFAEQGRSGIERRDYESAYKGVTSAQNIVMELINSLRPDQAPEICANLSSLYTYIYTLLVRGLSERDVAPLDEAVRHLRYERETWQMLLDKLAEENVSAGRIDQTPRVPDAPREPNGHAPHAASLIGGAVSLRG